MSSDRKVPHGAGLASGSVLGLFMWGLAILLALWIWRDPPGKQEEPVVPLTLSEQRDSIITYEAMRIGVPLDLAIAVSHYENTSGDSMAVSVKGAVGLMQVMPRWWQDEFADDCGKGSLFERQRNVCVGIHILKFYREEYGNWDRALRAYHGSHDTPEGRVYVAGVLEQLFPHNVDPDSTPLAGRVKTTHPKEGA